jgi:aspartate oxidase
MQNYDPQWKDLAPRDVVARSIHHEMLTHDVTHVYLDLGRYISKDDILSHFPNIHRDCLAYGVDITRDLVPVVPAAHYSCGGVWVDEWGQTTIDNLYAIGEVSCTGLHGANRLASTSLLEGLVWGDHAARHVAEHLGAGTGAESRRNCTLGRRRLREARPGSHRAGYELGQTHDVELCWVGAHGAAAGARAARLTRARVRDRGVLPPDPRYRWA